MTTTFMLKEIRPKNQKMCTVHMRSITSCGTPVSAPSSWVSDLAHSEIVIIFAHMLKQ